MNYGIITGLVNNIVVIDLDGPEARKWWEETGIGDSTAVVYSPRENGGEHHYFRVYDVEIQTNKGKIYPGVDVRGEGGLVAGPGSHRPDGFYRGDLTNIPDAPQALLDILPEKQSYTTKAPKEIAERFEGVTATPEEIEAAALEAKVTEPTESELNDIAHIKGWLLALPRTWSPGDGWHDTVFRSCAWLWRMVRTPSYALTEPEALDIMLNHTPVWPEWDEQRILEQWDSARELTRGQYADPPADQLPPVVDFIEVANLLPPFAPRSGREFFNVLGDEDAKPRNVMEECLIAGLTAHQTVSVIHGSAAGERYRGSEYGMRKLWREVEALAKKLDGTKGAPVAEQIIKLDPVPEAEIVRPKVVVPHEAPKIPLMSDAERELAHSVEWWGTEYLAFTREIVGTWNGPYHRINRWTILSCILAPVAVIPMSAGDMYLNLNTFVLGETTSGKSESLKIMNSVIRTYFSDEDDPDIGGDPSPSALGAALIERDNKTSLFNRDEAHGQIAQMKQERGYLVGLMELLTGLYDGEMPKMLRATNKEISGKRARTYFSIHYMGTFDGITEVLDPDDWESGFLHRFIWAIGEVKEQTRESLRPKMRKPGTARANDPRLMQKQWAAQFRALTMRIAPTGEPVDLDYDDAVLDRFVTMLESMRKVAEDAQHPKKIHIPLVRRMGNSILKATGLVALAQGRTKVELKDLYVAMLDGEEWFANALHMVTATDASKFSRQVAKVEEIVIAKGGEMRMEDVYRRVKHPKSVVDNLVSQLIAEGRAAKEILESGSIILRTIGGV